MEIKVLRDYETSDLDVIPECEKIATKIDIGADTEVLLDISDCLISYDATCKIIDAILEQLLKKEGKKKFVIRSNYKFPVSIIAQLLFRGSKFMGDEKFSNIDEEQIKTTLRTNLSGSEIDIYLAVNNIEEKYV